jgi:hypothetical protein
MLHRRLLGKSAVCLVLGLAVCACAPRTVLADEGPYPHLVHAIYEMREAKKELTEERFKPHREKAEKELERAIKETEDALKAEKIKWDYDGPKDRKKYYEDYKDFPHLRHALVELEAAKKEVGEEKKHEWGNRRKEVIESIDKAIEEVRGALKAEK